MQLLFQLLNLSLQVCHFMTAEYVEANIIRVPGGKTLSNNVTYQKITNFVLMAD